MKKDSHIHESCMGYCASCQRTHSLPVGNAEIHARRIMKEFERIQRLDYLSDPSQANPKYSFEQLFPGERGHMFGVMECLDSKQNTVILRAFSSLHGGIRHIDGWVPPVLDATIWDKRVLPTQTKIKALTAQMKATEEHSDEYHDLQEQRREISRTLMFELQESLIFTNFKGEKRSLNEAYNSDRKITGGIGDCCGPKLLNYAALNNLRPIGLAEFYWGKTSPDGSRIQGQLYPCCAEKCQTILGFMLCGLDE